MPLLGSGIFTTDGAQWEHSKNLIKPIFNRAQISDLSYLEKHVQRMVARIPENGSTIDLQYLLKLLVCKQCQWKWRIVAESAVPRRSYRIPFWRIYRLTLGKEQRLGSQ